MLREAGYDDDTEDEDEEENWQDTSWGCTDTQSSESTNKSRSQLKDKCVNPVTKPSSSVMLPAGTSHGVVDQGLMSRMLLNDNKAGMEGLDKDRINQVILEASKGSKYFENEKKKEEQVNKKIEEQMAKLKKISDVELRQGLTEADRLLEELEGQRDLSRVIVHIDMDAFYAAVEMREDPTLKDKPMAVGGYSMLSTSNYLARKFGVRAAMPGFIGKKLCPDLIMVKPNFEKYTAVSREIRSVMSDYDPNYCPMSLDEAYLDITDHLDKRIHSSEVDRTFLCRKSDSKDGNCNCDLNTAARDAVLTARLGCHQKNSELSSMGENTRGAGSVPTEPDGNKSDEPLPHNYSEVTLASRDLTGGPCPICGKPFPPYDVVTFGFSAEDSVKEMRSRIEQKTKLTASAGIASNMMLAKVCSDKKKPNGQYRIAATRDAVMGFITDLPIRKISGIGKVSEKMLNALNIHTCCDLYNQRALLYHLYSPISFNYFMRICMGIGSVNVERDSDRKSMSTERTFHEISKPEELLKKCQELCVSLCEDLREEKLQGKTVAIKLKTVKYEVKTRAQTLPDYTSDLEEVFSAAQGLLQTEIHSVAPHPLRLRLMGVRMSSLLNEDMCRKKQNNTLTRFVKQLGSTGSEEERSSNTSRSTTLKGLVNHNSGENMSCVMEDSNDTTSENKQCDVLGSKTSSTETAKTLYSIESPATFESASEHGFHTIKDLVPEEMSDCLKPKAITVSDVPMNSKDLEQSSMLRDDCGTYKIILCAGSSNSESVTEISKTVEKVNDNGISGDFRKSANDALLWNPASQVCESFDKEENLPDSSKGDNPIHAASPKPYNCPVCQDEIVCDDLSYFNQHIDICLNKKIVMDCSRYRPEEDRKTKLSKTPNSVKKRTPVRKLSGSPSTQKDNRKTKMSTSRLSSSLSSPKMSTPQLTSSLSSPRMGVSCTSDQAVTESKDDNCVDKSMATCTSTNNKLDVPDTGVTSSPLSGVSEGSIDTQKMVCPVCFMEQTGTSLDEFNTHVDTCLSKGTITQILQEQRVNTKRLSSGPSPQSVKRKRVDSGSSVPKTKCIDSFFQKVGLETGH